MVSTTTPNTKQHFRIRDLGAIPSPSLWESWQPTRGKTKRHFGSVGAELKLCKDTRRQKNVNLTKQRELCSSLLVILPVMVTFTAGAEDSEGTEWPTLVIWEGSPRTHTVEEEHCKIVPWPPQLCPTCHTTNCKPRTESNSWLSDSYEDRELAASLGEDFLLLPSKPRLPDVVIILTAQQLLKTALPSEHVFRSLDSEVALFWESIFHLRCFRNDAEKVEWGWDTLNFFLKIWIIA